MAASEKQTSLTQRQRQVYEFLRDQIQNRGYGPTVREIGDHFDIKSPNGVMCHLKALERKGLIHRESNMSRAICLSEHAAPRFSVPYLGAAASGRPIQDAASSDETVEFESVFGGQHKACIRVKGHEFAAMNIADGDHIIVDRDGEAVPGNLVATLDDQRNVRLHRVSASKNHSTVGQTLGVVVGVIRRFSESATLAEPADSEPEPEPVQSVKRDSHRAYPASRRSSS